MRRTRRILWVANVCLLPCGLLPLLVTLNAFNPMLLAFITDVQISNATTEPIRVTPIGVPASGVGRSPLPIYASRMPAWPETTRGGMLVAPGESLELLYDNDDFRLSELVVELANGRLLLLDVESRNTPSEVIQIQRVRDLPALQPGPVRSAYYEAMKSPLPWMSPWLLLPWATLITLLIVSARARRSMPTADPNKK